jgi:hypothetical protein
MNTPLSTERNETLSLKSSVIIGLFKFESPIRSNGGHIQGSNSTKDSLQVQTFVYSCNLILVSYKSENKKPSPKHASTTPLSVNLKSLPFLG